MSDSLEPIEETPFETLQRMNPRLYKLVEGCVRKMIKKNHDYAGARQKDFYRNLRSSERWGLEGWKGVLVRFGDKVARLENFAEQGVFMVEDENFEDTCQDGANYLLFMADMFAMEKAKNTSNNITPVSGTVEKRFLK